MKGVSKVLAKAGVPLQIIEEAVSEEKNSDAVWRRFVSSGRLTETDVFKAVAAVSALEFVDISQMDIPANALSVLEPDFCRTEKLIPIGLKGNYLFIGTDDPHNFTAVDSISASTNYNVVVKVITATALEEALERYFRADEEIGRLSEAIQDISEEVDDNETDLTDDDGSPVVRFVNLIINQAVKDRASDIHVEPGPKGLRVRYRIDGVLHVVQKADRSTQNGIISRLKIMSEIDIAEKRKPQDGRLSVMSGGKSIDIRVATIPIADGEKVVMRILDHSTEKRSIDYIGMSPANEKIFRRAIKKPHGMILITGPTGSGKSATVNVVLEEIANDSVNVMTVEDPIEKKIDGVNQTQINNKAGMTFASALRSILRADPDIIFIGEVRDDETASIAVDASMTGHLVLSTLHTNGAPEAAARLVEMGVEPYLVGSSVSCVVAQRLARRLCRECMTEVNLDQELIDRVNFPYTDIKFYEPVGCNKCAKTGFRGRIAVTEVMEIDEEIEALIIAGQPASAIRRHAESKNLVSLRQDGWERVKDGITTIEEILRVTA